MPGVQLTSQVDQLLRGPVDQLTGTAKIMGCPNLRVLPPALASFLSPLAMIGFTPELCARVKSSKANGMSGAEYSGNENEVPL